MMNLTAAALISRATPQFNMQPQSMVQQNKTYPGPDTITPNDGYILAVIPKQSGFIVPNVQVWAIVRGINISMCVMIRFFLTLSSIDLDKGLKNPPQPKLTLGPAKPTHVHQQLCCLV